MRVILGPVPCHACRAPVIWGQTGETFGWREPSGALHHCEPVDIDERREAIGFALDAGHKYTRIAREHGITKQRVGQIAKRLGHRRYAA